MIARGIRLAQGQVTRLAQGQVTRLAQGQVTRLAQGQVTRLAQGQVTRLAQGQVTRLARGWRTRLARGWVARLARGWVARAISARRRFWIFSWPPLWPEETRRQRTPTWRTGTIGTPATCPARAGTRPHRRDGDLRPMGHWTGCVPAPCSLRSPMPPMFTGCATSATTS